MQNTSVPAAPVQIFVPPSNGTATAFITNNGPGLVYLGGPGVTANSGFVLPIGQSIDVTRLAFPIFAASAYRTTATATTTTAANASGDTSLAITSGTGTANGQLVLVGTGSASEVVTIISGGGTTTLTTTALNYDHKSGAAVTVITSLGTTVGVVAGAN